MGLHRSWTETSCDFPFLDGGLDGWNIFFLDFRFSYRVMLHGALKKQDMHSPDEDTGDVIGDSVTSDDATALLN